MSGSLAGRLVGSVCAWQLGARLLPKGHTLVWFTCFFFFSCIGAAFWESFDRTGSKSYSWIS